MNSIMMVVGAVIAVLIVFIIFSQEELDDEPEDYYDEEPAEAHEEVVKVPGSTNEATEKPTPTSLIQKPPEEVHELKESGTTLAKVSLVGSEEDFKLRFSLYDQTPPVSHSRNSQGVAVSVQFRFPEISKLETGNLVSLLNKAEKVLAPEELSFPFSVFLGDQTNRLLLFGFDEDRDDAVFEALVTSSEIVAKFKKLLETDGELLQAKARVAIGISQGSLTRIFRGPLGPITHAGKPVYLAETFAESAGDFQIYVDEETHRFAKPLFDFREWKPTRLRQSLPPMPFFELVGWNKKEEIFAVTSSSETFARRAVAIAYRYLDFDDISPLLGLVSDPDEKVAMDALATVAEIGDDRALGILKKILPEAKNALLRSSIIEALGKMGREEVAPALLASTKDVNWQVRYHAVRSLYRISHGEAIKHIEHMVNDEDGAVRAEIHFILFQQYHNEENLAALRELLRDLSLRARKAAVEALISIGTNDALLLVAKSFAEQEPEMKRHILRLMIRVKSKVLYQCFLTMFHTSNSREHSEIVAAVRRSELMN